MTKFCSNCLVPQRSKDRKAINLIKKEYLSSDRPWYIGYSGGKDSSAVLKLVFNALAEIDICHKPVEVIYCDTGVEIPTISSYVKTTIDRLANESEGLKLPFKFTIAKPRLDDRYFVKVIGRGYPPPTNIFRWCTDRLRINPVKSVIGNSESTVVLGIRSGESEQRDRTIQRHKTKEKYHLRQEGAGKTTIFSPILEFTVKDVWATLKYTSMPLSIDHSIIGQLYKDAGAECPVYRDSKGSPCGTGRFGCWTCTVVRRDKSVESLVSKGYSNLQPLFEFRNWLAEFRDNKKYRCQTRRNGSVGLGPITLKGRSIILERLLNVQTQSKLGLIEVDELERIQELWELDANSRTYRDEAYFD